jgi:peptidoglycan/xylan/chitin deacetylase (PgdA/CDA1 family)
VIAVSSLLRRAVYPAMSRTKMFSRRVGAGEVCVLTYHGVLPESMPGNSPIEGALISADQFRLQLRFLKSRYQLISPDVFRAWLKKGGSLPQRAVLLTCDDGLRNVLTAMVPILLEEEAQCLFFVTGGSLEESGGSLWYEDLYRMVKAAPGDAGLAVGGKRVRKDSLSAQQLVGLWLGQVEEYSKQNSSDRARSLCALRGEWLLPESGYEGETSGHGLMNRHELEKLAGQGMSVGAHTMSHPVLAKMSSELAEEEIRECKTRLESLLQQEIWALAYPFGNPGSAGVREMTMAENAGYDCAFLNFGGGLLRQSSPRFGLPRAHVTGEMSMAEMEAHLSGFHEALQRRFRGEVGVLASCA